MQKGKEPWGIYIEFIYAYVNVLFILFILYLEAAVRATNTRFDNDKIFFVSTAVSLNLLCFRKL